MNNVRVTVKVGLVLSIVLLAANAVRLGLPRAKAQGISVVPHTLVVSETMIAPDGRRQSGPSQTWAVRSDGSVASSEGVTRNSRQIRFVSGRHVLVNDKTRAKSTTQGRLEDAWVLDPRTGCTKTITGGIFRKNLSAPVVEQVFGYRTVRLTWGGVTSWFALDYSCAVVKRRSTRADGSASEHQLASLIPGEPAAWWFEVPHDYREGPPSALRTRTPPPNCDARCQESQRVYFEDVDKSYYRNRAQ